MSEVVYARALEAVAMGLTWDETKGALVDAFPSVSPDQITDEMHDAYRDALKQGVDREDIDPSWR